MKFSLKKFFAGKQKSVIGVDIGSSAVKIVQARKEGGVAILETYGAIEIGPYVEGGSIGQYANPPKETLHTILSVLMRELNISTKEAGIPVPFHASFISLISVPSFSDEKLAQILPFEARRHIPVPLEDISIDWFPIPREILQGQNTSIFENTSEKPTEPKDLKRQVMLMAIHNSELRKYKEIFASMQLNINFFEIEVYSTHRSVVYGGRTPTLIVDIGARTTKFYAMDRGIALRSYFINQGGQTMTNAIATAENISFADAEYKKREKGFTTENQNVLRALSLVADEIFSEINTARVDFEQKYHRTMSKVVFSGGGSATKGLLDEAKKKVNIEVELANPFSRMRHPAAMSKRFQEIGPEFSVAIGAAMRALGA